MALHNDDLMVVQKHDGGQEIRKATIQQLSEHLQAGNSVNYEGLRNFSQSGDQPTERFQGDLYINSGPDGGAWAWDAGNSSGLTTVNAGDRAIWNQTDGTWDVIQSGSDDAGVTEVTGSLPIEVEDGDTASPNVTIRTATTTVSGAVNRLATTADVNAADGTADPSAVVTADLLKATNIAVEGAVAGGLAGILGVDPIVTSTADDGGTTTTPSIKILDAAAGQKGAIEIQPVGAAPVTDVDKAATPGYVDAHYVPSDFSSLDPA